MKDAEDAKSKTGQLEDKMTMPYLTPVLTKAKS